MEKKIIKNIFLGKKFLMVLIAILIIVAIYFFAKIQNYKFELLYQYQVIPHVDLINTLNSEHGVIQGEVRGFVKFDNIANQPEDLWQYYILKPLDSLDDGSSQEFSLEEIIVMKYLPPKSLGVSRLMQLSENDGKIILIDESGNQYFIDKYTKEIFIRDITGDNTSLITDIDDYKDFMVIFKK